MLKWITGATLAAALAVSGPAAAGAPSRNEVLGAVAGVAGVYLLARTIEEAQAKDQAPQVVHYRRDDDRWRHEREGRGRPPFCNLKASPKSSFWRKYIEQCGAREERLPRVCLRKRWTREGWVTYYDRPCVERARRHDDDRYRHHEHRRRD